MYVCIFPKNLIHLIDTVIKSIHTYIFLRYFNSPDSSDSPITQPIKLYGVRFILAGEKG